MGGVHRPVCTTRSNDEADQNHKNIANSGYDKQQTHDPAEAIALVRNLSFAKFDKSVDLVFELGINPRQAGWDSCQWESQPPEQNGKDGKVAVFAESDQAREAEEAGADIIGGAELAEAMQSGSQALDFDVVIAVPSTQRPCA